jgi:hypothetical protein
MQFMRITVPATQYLTILALLLLGFASFCALAGAEPETTPEEAHQVPAITDKTLVAWVYLANTTQRGGSALTLIDPLERMNSARFAGGGGSGLKEEDQNERFDAMVFGELAAGKWMAGSDMFNRTLRDQAALPEETADAGTLVQMAIVYQGKEVRVYRNGHLYSAHAISKPQTFQRNAMVLLGLRYLGQLGRHGFLAGAIEEARIYGVALDAAALAALAPGKPSDPKPLAQWTFEDGTTADSMHTFPPGKLCGNARIADGKLHLDGETAYLVTPPPVEVPMDPTPQGMFYKPTSPETGGMWDSWVFYHAATYYLYTTSNAGGKLLDNVSMASSPDGVHWTEIGRVFSRHPDSDWLGTGSTWKSCNFDKDGKFFMDFCERRDKGRRPQEIYFAESTDLIHWKRLDDTHVFASDPRWYAPGCWTTIWTLPRPGGGLFGYWTCTTKPETGGSFGFGESVDGLTWKALPPPKAEGVGFCELGAVEKIGNKYYAMVGVDGRMRTLVADRPEGPFSPATKNLRLLGGDKAKSPRGQFFAYFTRFCRTPDDLLVNHHTIARDGQVYLGLLKSAVVDVQGTLRLGWWKGNEKLKDDATVLPISKPTVTAGPHVTLLGETFDVGAGIILEGRLAMPASAEAAPAGIYISYGEATGSAIRVHAGGRCEIGEMNADGSDWNPENLVDREMDCGTAPTFRLLLKKSVLEFYLNDILIECYSMPAKATGRIGLLGGVGELKAWNCKSPKQ